MYLWQNKTAGMSGGLIWGCAMKREGLSAVLPVSAAAVEQIDAWMPQCYYRDDYPREGCMIVLTIEKDRVLFTAYAPNGKTLECGPTLPRDQAGRAVDEWLSGIAPRVRPLDRHPDLPSPDKAG